MEYDLSKPEPIDPGWSWDDKYSFFQAVRLGPWVYITGQVGMDSEGNIVGPDMESQAKKTFENMQEILEAAGGSLDNIVRVRAYILDFDQYPDYERVRARALSNATFASTAVEVSRLAINGLIVEVDGTAYIQR